MSTWQGQLIDEPWEPVAATSNEERLVGRVVMHATRLEDTLLVLLTVIRSPDAPPGEIRQRYLDAGGEQGVVQKIRNSTEPDTDPSLKALLDECEGLLEERHGYAHGILIQTTSGDRVMLRRVRENKAGTFSRGHRDVGVPFDVVGAETYVIAANLAMRELARVVVTRRPDLVGQPLPGSVVVAGTAEAVEN